MICTLLRQSAQQLLAILQRGILLLGDGMEQTLKFQLNGGAPCHHPLCRAGNIRMVKSHLTIGLEIGSGGGWLGQIDEVAVWIGRNDLTISEVQQLYNNGAGLPFSSFR